MTTENGMPERITWTETADAQIAALRACGATWDRIAAALGVSRNSALTRARQLREGTPAPAARITRPRPAPVEDPNRAPLPPGHPVSWAVLTEGTCLDGAPYPEPDKPSRRASPAETPVSGEDRSSPSSFQPVA
jgi:hypothetical protein